MTTLATYVTGVATRVPDDGDRLTQAQVESLISQAVRQYSTDRPKLSDVLLWGDGTAQAFAVPSDWAKGFSRPLEWEHPVDMVPVSKLEPIADHVQVVQRNNLEYLITPLLTLEEDKAGRVFYHTLHTVDADVDTVPPADHDAVTDLAAAKACEAIAAFYSDSLDPALAADFIEHRDKARRFLDMAKVYRESYINHMHGGESRGPILQLFDMDPMPGGNQQGRDFRHDRKRTR